MIEPSQQKIQGPSSTLSQTNHSETEQRVPHSVTTNDSGRLAIWTKVDREVTLNPAIAWQSRLGPTEFCPTHGETRNHYASEIGYHLTRQLTLTRLTRRLPESQVNGCARLPSMIQSTCCSCSVGSKIQPMSSSMLVSRESSWKRHRNREQRADSSWADEKEGACEQLLTAVRCASASSSC